MFEGHSAQGHRLAGDEEGRDFTEGAADLYIEDRAQRLIGRAGDGDHRRGRIDEEAPGLTGAVAGAILDIECDAMHAVGESGRREIANPVGIEGCGRGDRDPVEG